MYFRLITTLLQAVLCIPVAVSATACAQKATAETLGWDLSYSSVLDANGVGPDEWIRKWLGPNDQSAAKGWVLGWNREPIESSVLVEFPASHAGERIVLWLVRTNSQAYYYERAEGSALHKDDKPPHERQEALDVQAYDKFFSVVSTWQQRKGVQPQDTPVGGVPGYSGFLSLYNSGNSRQMLLTIEDWAICDTKKCDSWKAGRLMEALKILPMHPGAQYRHQSEAQIAAMTPAQRVDEYRQKNPGSGLQREQPESLEVCFDGTGERHRPGSHAVAEIRKLEWKMDESGSLQWQYGVFESAKFESLCLRT